MMYSRGETALGVDSVTSSSGINVAWWSGAAAIACIRTRWGRWTVGSARGSILGGEGMERSEKRERDRVYAQSLRACSIGDVRRPGGMGIAILDSQTRELAGGSGCSEGSWGGGRGDGGGGDHIAADCWGGVGVRGTIAEAVSNNISIVNGDPWKLGKNESTLNATLIPDVLHGAPVGAAVQVRRCHWASTERSAKYRKVSTAREI
ncbi:hypothetical protein Tco_0820181 [Tanacetum coccineum]|uniref:Uncharacterized protein n=1 Tax=Tanacetum coccineum TaxID=301880 RepID=A0ABQ5ABB1_9ASTR